MTDKSPESRQYAIPSGMLDTALDAVNAHFITERDLVRKVLGAALRWLSDNPIVPTEKQKHELYHSWSELRTQEDLFIWVPSEWQRRMFISSALEQEHKDGTVEWKTGTTIPLGVWGGGKLYPTNIPCSESEVPEGIRNLLLDENIPTADFSRPTRRYYNMQVIDAYSRGLKEGKK